ncbi:hypothetical protein JCM8097_002295 [Rhodosporidiobolus ruineniae]
MIPRIPHSSLYRRRPPRPSSSSSSSRSHRLVGWLSCLCLLSLLSSHSALAQTVTTLTVPSTTTFNLSDAASAHFSLPTSSSSSSLSGLSISLSLCAPPDNLLSTLNALPTALPTALYISTSSSLPSPGPGDSSPDSSAGGSAALSFGYAAYSLSDDEAAQADGVWIGVFAPSGADLLRQAKDEDDDADESVSGSWTFELDVRAAGTEDWVLAEEVGLRVEDSDRSAVLLSTPSFADANETAPSAPGWVPLVVETQEGAYELSRSRCFVQRMRAGAVRAEEVKTSTTARGYGGGTRSQFEVQGLEAGRNYTAWLVQNSTLAAGGGNETKVWDPVFFQTKTSDSCRLVYDLDFCPSVAYSVPAPPSLSTADLISYFNASLSPSLSAFARTLTTFPCDVPSMGQYSVVSTCADCYAAYRDFVCATTMPRCTDAPANATLNDTTTTAGSESGLATWAIPEEPQTALVRTDPFASRTPAFGPANLSSTFPSLFNASFPLSPSNALAASPFPYAELPPCTDVCDLVQARCPPFLAWTCPSVTFEGGLTGTAGWGVTRKVDDEGRMAGDVSGSERDERAADRFGNVYCNALYTDLTSAAQFVDLSSTGQSTSSASPYPPSPASLALILVPLLLIAFAFF